MADLIFPNISFDESDVGPRPTIPQEGNRIGVVGEFLRGPYKRFQLVGTPDGLMRHFGRTTHNGSLAIQTAMDQGANDFGVIRVMGASVPAGAFLSFTLPAGVDKLAYSGRLLLFSSGVIATIRGSGADKKETLAARIVKAINQAGSGIPLSASLSDSTITLTASGEALQDLPLLFRLANPTDRTALAAGPTGVLFLDRNGQPIPMFSDTLPAGAIQRLGGGANVAGSLQFTVAYGPGAILDVKGADSSLTAASSLKIGIGTSSWTGIVGSTSLEVEGTPAVGDVVSLTITGAVSTQTATITLTANEDTLAKVATKLAAEFGNTFKADNKIALAANNALVTVTANAGAGAIVLSAATTPAASAPSTSIKTAPADVVLPADVSPYDLAKALADRINATSGVNLLASAALNGGDAAKLRVYSTQPITAAKTLTKAVAGDVSDVSTTWDLPAIAEITGFQQDCVLHLLLGAEMATQATITSPADIAAGLVTSITDRGLPLTATVSASNPKEIELHSKISGEDGNEVLYGLVQVNAAGTIPASGIDANLTVKTRPDIINPTIRDVSPGVFYPLGGGVDGPRAGSATFRRRKCVKKQAQAVLSYVAAAGSTPAGIRITFSDGLVRIDKTDIVLRSIVAPVVRSGASGTVTIVVSDAGVAEYRSAPNANEIAIGTFVVPSTMSNDSLGTFTAAMAGREEMLIAKAGSEGAWSSSVNVSLSQAGAGGLITVRARYKNPTDENFEEEVYEFKLTQAGTLDGRNYIRQTIGSPLIELEYVGGDDAKIEELVSENWDMTGGKDGPVVSVKDYQEAIRAMSSQPVNILIASGRTEDNIRSELISQASNSTEIEGLRIAVLAASGSTRAAQANLQSKMYDSKYGVMVAGWCTYAGRTDLAPLSVPPDGFYAGHMAVTRVEASMAARTSSPGIKGVLASDVEKGTDKFTEYTKARMDCLIQDPATGAFHMLNGRSLSSDTAWYWIHIRRVYNHIRSNVFNVLQFAKSEPNTPLLRRRVAQTVDNFMFLMFSKNQIAGFQPTKVDDENNPGALIAMGQLRADVFFTPIFPADFITVGLHRVIPVSVTA